MTFILVYLFGVTNGGIFMWLLLEWRFARFKQRQAETDAREHYLDSTVKEMESREQMIRSVEQQCITFIELRNENSILKRDLQTVQVSLNKLHLDADFRQRKLIEDQTPESKNGRN
jgi:hypothetical protein